MDTSLSSLIELDELHALSRRSNARGLTRLLAHAAIITTFACAVVALRRSGHPWASVPAMAALGVALVALFAPLHDTTHRTPFRSLWLNRIVGWLTGLILVLPPEGFRLFHLAHHRHTQDPDRDPELIGAPQPTRASYLWRLTGLPYWRSQLALVWTTARGRVGEPWVPPASRPTVVRQSRVFLVVYATAVAVSVAARSDWAIWLYLIPVLLGQPALRAVLMAEHGGLAHGPDRLANTRTTLAGRLVATLFWNAHLHAEHHLAPGVPFHSLPRLHRRLRPHLRAVSNGYGRAHAEIRAPQL